MSWLWILSAGAWAATFVAFRDEMQQFALSVAAVLIYGLAILIPNLTNSASGVVGGGLGLVTAALSSIALSWLLITLTYISAVFVTVRVLSELLLMRRIRRQALKTYSTGSLPIRAVEKHTRLAWGNTIRPWATLIILAPLCLLTPVLGGLLLFVLMSYLNARFLVNDATDGLAPPDRVRRFISERRVELTLVGIYSSVVALLPIIGLISPWATGSAVCHLAMRYLQVEQSHEGNSSPPLGESDSE